MTRIPPRCNYLRQSKRHQNRADTERETVQVAVAVGTTPSGQTIYEVQRKPRKEKP